MDRNCPGRSNQGLYEQIFGLDGRGVKDTHRRLTWLAFWVGWLFLTSVVVGPAVRAAGPAVFAIVGLIGFILFWWFTMWLLLGGRVSWRRLLPRAVATGVFWLGMEAVSTRTRARWRRAARESQTLLTAEPLDLNYKHEIIRRVHQERDQARSVRAEMQ